MIRQKGEMKRRVGSRRLAKEQRRATKRKPRKARVAPAPAADLREQVDTLTLELKEARAHQAATGEILASLTGTITDAKPVFDAIVRNLQRLFDTRLSMVQLLKDGVQYNALVEESLNLAYHGARAEKQGFEITLERSFDPGAGKADVFPKDITRVLLNLISNGFYAANRRRAETNGGDYEPTLTAATKNLG